MKNKPRKLNITVIGSDGTFDKTKLVAQIFSIGERNVTSISDLAAQLEKLCDKGDRVVGLHIMDHGNESGQYIGGDWLDLGELPKHRANLSRLTRCFQPGAVVTMGGCKVGHAMELLIELSVLWGGVRVQAGTANQRPAIPGLEGGVTQCVLRVCSYSGRTLFDRLDGN